MNKPSRILFIDYLRGLAVIVMIEVHVVNAFLKTEIRENWWFEIVNYINGLVAPSFLFITGFAFAITLERKWDDYLQFNRVLIKQIQRILQIWIIGYLLHLPYFSYRKIFFEMTETAKINFFKVDVLHCIAISLIILIIMVLILRNKNLFLKVSIFISLVLIFLSPIVWNYSFKNLPTIIAMYLNTEQGSLFPIFPWMGFVFMGVVVAFNYLKHKNDNLYFNKVIYKSIAIIIVTVFLKIILGAYFATHYNFRTSPNFFFQRVAIVTLLLGIFGLIESKNKLRNSFINISGSESLIIYSVHLMVIFGLFFNEKSLAFIIGKTQNFGTTILWSIELIALMVALAYLWHFIKNKSMVYARVIQYSFLIVALYIFINRRF